jgi:two-component system sensor histidine kinase KdpD
VQTHAENPDKIPLDKQRHLLNNFKTATELGAEVVQVQSKNIARAIVETAEQKQITTICMGAPHFSLFRIILRTNLFNQLLKKMSEADIDLIILS